MDVQTSPSRVNQVDEGVGEFPEVDKQNGIKERFWEMYWTLLQHPARETVLASNSIDLSPIIAL